jgi:hypothetical protein
METHHNTFDMFIVDSDLDHLWKERCLLHQTPESLYLTRFMFMCIELLVQLFFKFYYFYLLLNQVWGTSCPCV